MAGEFEDVLSGLEDAFQADVEAVRSRLLLGEGAEDCEVVVAIGEGVQQGLGPDEVAREGGGEKGEDVGGLDLW